MNNDGPEILEDDIEFEEGILVEEEVFIEEENELYYIEFFVSGVLTVNSYDKKQKVKKIQKLLNKIVEDQSLDLIKSDSNLLVLSESEVIQNMTSANFNPDEEN